jgi:putative serine protease PepD
MRLRYETGEHAGRTIDVSGRSFVVGRDGGADIVLRGDTEVSRRHATLEPRPDGTLVLTDLGSTNGTYVDGRRISGPVALRGGEIVRFGDTTLVASGPPGGAAAEPSATVGRPGGPPSPSVPPSGAPAARAAPPSGALPLPPAPPSASVIERLRLRRSVTRANALAACAVGLAVVVVGAFVALLATGSLKGSDAAAPALPSTEATVASVTPSTVLVTTRQGGEDLASGSGWVLDSRQGLIVTNAHVVNGGDSWSVGVDDERRAASFVAAAPCEDQAVLKLADPTGLRTMALGSQRTLKPGQGVIAVGFPVNASEQDNLTSTAGVVSVVRTQYRGALDVPDLPNVIQTDAAINPGNSGGPLVDFRSRLVGMNTAGLDLVDGRTIQGQGYAIGVDRIKDVTAKLRRGRSMADAGFGLEPATRRELAAAGLPPGMHTVEAIPGSPADRAGFGDGVDRSITAVDGRRLNGSLPDYCSAVEGFASGQTATFTVAQAGRRPRKVELEFM